MSESPTEEQGQESQLRLLLEELCCELCRFEHVAEAGVSPHAVRIDRERYLGKPGLFADIIVRPPTGPAYVLEVKFGYSNERILSSLRRKYCETSPPAGVEKIILVVDQVGRGDWPAVEAELAASLGSALKLEVWSESRLAQLLRERFCVDIETITPDNLLEVRIAIDRTQGFHAFGSDSLADYEHEPLNSELLWHFGYWKLQHLRESRKLQPREILPPGLYRGVAVILADLCSFSSYVRDTPDSRIVRECLTSFYSKARYQILNNGGMLYQFVGDEVIGFFGIPDKSEGFSQAALDTARALLDIGNSVSHHWQRQIDRVQSSGGVHVGVAMGDLQIVSLRPFSRTHVGAVGDCINVAARLMSVAGSNEIAVSNSFLQSLPERERGKFTEVEPVEARNVGRIKAWKT